MVVTAQSGLELYQRQRLMSLVAKDNGRFIVTLLALAMHHGVGGEGGLEPRRLGALAAQTGLCSAMRARALVWLLTWGGYLAPAGEGRLQPTIRLMAMHRERLGRQLAALALVAPEALPAASRVGEDLVVAGFCRAQAQRFLAGARFSAAAPELAGPIGRNGGLLVLLSLWLAAIGEMPPLSAAAMARRCRVWYPEVVATLRMAESAGLLRRERRAIRLLPSLEDALERFFAELFRHNAEAAVEAVAWADAQMAARGLSAMVQAQSVSR